MNRQFLYTKPRVTVLGILDGNDNNNDLASWFLDDTRKVMAKKFSESSIEELMIDLIDIFRGGNPNYLELMWLLEFQGIEKRFEETTKIIKSCYINRINKDLTKVEIYIDTSFIVRKLHLYARELLPAHLLLDRIYKVYTDISCEINSDLIIHEKECTIVLSQG